VVVLWGSGKAYREFMFVGDAADALVFLMRKYNESEIINVGTGNDLTISQLANMVKTAINFKGKIKWDTTKPDGIPRKLLDISKLKKLGWRPKTSLEQGIKNEYEWYLNNYIK